MVTPMRVVERVEAGLHAGDELSIEQVGGLCDVLDQAEDITLSPVFDEIVRMIAREWDAHASTPAAAVVVQLVAHGLATNPRPACLANAVDAILAHTTFARDVTKTSAPMLVARAGKERQSHPLAAAYALEAVLRMALEGYVSRHVVLAAFDELSGDEPEMFVAKVARLVGVASDAWRYNDTPAVLGRLLGASGSEDDVAFELGIASLSRALDAADAETILSGIADARQWFARAERAAEGRLDAIAYGAVVDAVLNFSSNRSKSAIDAAVQRLNSALLDERWIFGANTPIWLRPRATATLSWGALALELTHVAASVQRHSWFEAARVLQRVLDIYRCNRRVRRTGELAPVVQPAIEAAFVAQQGLLAHLDDFLADDGDSMIDKGVAKRLREKIRARAKAPPPGKIVVDGRWDAAVSILGADTVAEISQESPGTAAMLDRAVRGWVVAQTESPLLDDMLSGIDDALSDNLDYQGQVRYAFRKLVLLTLRFARDRQDRQRSSGDRRLEYLFAWGAAGKPPLEKDLGLDYRDFLVGSELSRAVHAEVRDIAGGRADVLFDFYQFRFVAELKREFDDASRVNVRQFLGQAGLYSGTDVHLGLLLVLDLTDKSTGVPSFRDNVWCEKLAATSLRHVVVVRVPGNRIHPSATSTPTMIDNPTVSRSRRPRS